MSVIDLEAARKRLQAPPPANPILEALDTLALALAEHGHVWTEREASLYEGAVSYLKPSA